MTLKAGQDAGSNPGPTGRRRARATRRPRGRKALGQHFLRDRNYARRIVEAAEIGPRDTVVEIGPGRGALTRLLAGRAGTLVLVEIDPLLAGWLADRYAGTPRVRVENGDAREIDIGGLAGVAGQPYRVVGNLPYYAASPIIRRVLESAHPPVEMVVMVQREVAQQMCAAPGRMSMLSVATQLYAEPRIAFHVPPRAFAPPPRVRSSVVRLKLRACLAVDVDSRTEFFNLVRAGFSAPRKKVSNSLAVGFGIPAGELAPLLAAAGIEAGRRPATLSMAEWAGLYRIWRRSDGESSEQGEC